MAPDSWPTTLRGKIAEGFQSKWTRISLLLLTLLLSGCARTHEYTGLIFEDAEPAPSLVGTNLQGESFSLADLEGRLVIIFFGYSFCPDVCPLTLADLAEAVNMLEREDPTLAQRVEVLFVSIDPERDTPERLEAYLNAFRSDFRGLIVDAERFDEVKRGYGVFVARNPNVPEDDANYLVDHTSGLYVIDPQGRWAGLFRYETPVEALVADISELLQNKR